MNVAIIPARGGSKRIPRKNVKDFCGKPIIAYSIEAALECKYVDRVIVSTDDAEIARIAKKYGAEVPFIRPIELSDDITDTTSVVRHALDQMIDDKNNIDICACIYATAPFLQSNVVDDAISTLINHPSDFIFTANRFAFPIQRALLKNEDGGVVPYCPEEIKARSQDLTETFHDAGQLYVAKANTWLSPDKHIFSSQSRMIVLPSYKVQDIDTVDDWVKAEVMFNVLQQMGEM